MNSNFHLDWLSFTWHRRLLKVTDISGTPIVDRSDLEVFCEVFPELVPLLRVENSTLLRGKRNFYDFTFLINDGIQYSFCSDAGSRMGVNVSIPSQGLYCLYNALGTDDAVVLLKLLRDRGCKFSRIDLAFDDFTKSFRPRDFMRFWDEGQLLTNFRSFRFYASEHNRGDTFQLGSRSTGKLLRIYDKDYESDGEIPAIRYEIEVHSHYAENLATIILEHNGLWFADSMDQFFRVLDPEHLVKNRSQQRSLPAWQSFLELEFSEGMPIKIPGRKASRTVAGSADWFNNACSKLRTISEVAFRGHTDEFLEFLYSHPIKINDKILFEDPFYRDQFLRCIYGE